MTISITVSEVREVAPNTGATDAAIQLQIDIATEKIDDLLEANYSPTVARAIKIYTVAHFSYRAANPSGVTSSRRWSDSKSESYQNRTDTLFSDYWDNLQALDTAGIVDGAYSSRKVFCVTGKSSMYYEDAQ